MIRQWMAEVVFRNKPMFDYLFENNLYNTDGLTDVFARASSAMQQGAPYRQQNAPGEPRRHRSAHRFRHDQDQLATRGTGRRIRH